LFPLTEAYDYGATAAREVADRINGRSVIDPHDAGVISQAIVISKHGNHVEIGTFFGASAIVAAMTKREFDLVGDIHCIDPLKNISSKEAIMDNACMFGVEDRIIIHEEYSDPWPIKGRFATGFIDGDHWNDMPLVDWLNMEQVVSHMVIFHDYCRGKPDVTRACLVAAGNPRWIPVHIGGMSFVIRRRE
jgi:predicted O-methyltransferase YrrM